MLSVFYSLIPLLPQPYKADIAGVSVSPGFFWLNKLKPSVGVGLPSPSQPH